MSGIKDDRKFAKAIERAEIAMDILDLDDSMLTKEKLEEAAKLFRNAGRALLDAAKSYNRERLGK